jgi:hypothetical protein
MDEQAHWISPSTWLALASGLVIISTAVGAWVTFDFWETIPLVPCVVSAALLAALAAYLPRRSTVVGFAVGFAVGSATFLVALVITLGRWEG